jgi:hypothetical protein
MQMSFKPHWLSLFLLIGCTGLEGTKITDTGVEVADVDVLGIIITPDEVIVPVGSDIQLEALGLNNERESFKLTDVVEWSSGSPTVASISNDLSKEGVLSGISAGTTVVYANFDDVQSAPSIITVTDAELSRLAITPPSVSLPVGDTVQLTAEATFSDGSSSDASSQVRWITDDGSIATIDDVGLLMAESEGLTTIQVQWGEVASEPITVEVNEDVPTIDTDLFVDSIASSVTDDRFEVTVGIRNSGSLAVSNFWVDLFMDPVFTPTYGDFPDWYHFVEYIGAGDTAFITISAGTFAYSHEYAVLLDSMEEIPETNEGNNLYSGSTEDDPFTDGGSSDDGEPNLTITYVGSYADGGQTEYWVDVSNVGDADADGFYIDVFHDTAWDDEPLVYAIGTAYLFQSSLPAGETVYATLIVEDECGDCGAWAQVDSFDLVEESDELDNTEYIEAATYWVLPASPDESE